MRHKLHDQAALLIAHIACTDKQLHSREMKQLAAFLRNDASDVTAEEINKILEQADDAIDLTSVLSNIPVTEQKRTLEIAFRMAYADGHLHLEESTLLKQIAGKWNISAGGMKAIDAKARYGTAHEDETIKKPTAPEAKIVQTLDLLFSKGLLSAVAKSDGGVWQRKLRRLRHQVLFAGPEYAVAVQHCREVAKHDFTRVESHLKQIQKMLENLQTNLRKTIIEMDTGTKKTGNEKKKVLDSLQELRNDLSTTLADNVVKTREGLAAKHRSLQYFTVAFMGKTKAGKSTLHAVITGQGWDEIGSGEQRKTRYNRVYEIDHLRIIDTPGIGSPEADGRTDEEIAMSIVDEADIICFVVTSDNQQKEEFEFLQTLKTAGKPLVILLNWRNGLNGSRLRRFIRDADEILSPKPVADPKLKNARDVSGHLRRIKDYAAEYYENNYFDIIPVHLYAAQLARKGEMPEFENELYDASKVEDFLNCIRMGILRDGAIHRSQTLLGSSAGSVETVRDWLEKKAIGLYDMAVELQKSRDRLDTIMSKAESEAKQEMHGHIKSYFQRLRDQEVPEFAERHYNTKSEQLGKEWQNWLKNRDLIDALQSHLQATFSHFKDKVKEGLEEVGKDLEMMARLKMERLTFDSPMLEFSWQNLVRIGSVLVGLAGRIITRAYPAVGLVIVKISTLVRSWASRLESKEKKRRKAVTKLRNTLHKELNSQESKVLKEQTKDFEKHSKKIRQDVFQHFGLLNESLKAIGSLCGTGKDDLEKEVNSINRAYASRVLQWLKQDSQSEITLEKQVIAVNRQCGSRMKIHTSLEKRQIRPLEDVHRALQEDLEISWNGKPTLKTR